MQRRVTIQSYRIASNTKEGEITTIGKFGRQMANLATSYQLLKGDKVGNLEATMTVRRLRHAFGRLRKIVGMCCLSKDDFFVCLLQGLRRTMNNRETLAKYIERNRLR